MAHIYLATSWRNLQQPDAVRALRDAGHTVYDFRNPEPGNTGFSWRKIAEAPPPWSAEETRRVLDHAEAARGFALDLRAMEECDVCVMLQPSGRSAALELGWAVGAGKRTAVLLADEQEPELMLKCADRLCTSMEELLSWIEADTVTPGARVYGVDPRRAWRVESVSASGRRVTIATTTKRDTLPRSALAIRDGRVCLTERAASRRRLDEGTPAGRAGNGGARGST